ncbi:hypothetical protein [Deinococcus sp. JMULE3]|uniref:hypothetical protein n=1 Tax=Deinococcus sp. JMULE3 TaxID=2518341 RepID=UPI001575A589|nr:hypothetical protein [Deinococcus sp. JMULE3]NTY02037.1 hypothetical protein [Deinococcus sp. JMULE3]
MVTASMPSHSVLRDLQATTFYEKQWLLQGGSPEALLDQYRAHGSVLSFLRGTIFAMHQERYTEAHDFLRTAFLKSTTLQERLMVSVYSTSLQLYLSMENQAKQRSYQGDGLELLLDGLHQLQSSPDRDMFALEVEYRVLWMIVHLQNTSGRYSESLPFITQMRHIAFLMGHEEFQHRADSLRAWALGNTGGFHEALTLRKELDTRDTMASVTTNALDIAMLLANLGNLDQALETLNAATQLPDDQQWILLIQSIFGVQSLDMQETLFTGRSARYQWMPEVLRHLAHLYALEPLRSRTADRLKLANQIVDKMKVDLRGFGSDDRSFAAWVLSAAHLNSQNYGLARQSLSGLPPLHSEQLLTRALLAAARLELALEPGFYEVETVMRSEQDLRSIFGTAEQLTHASPAGLAKAVQRWHPVAAAYLAVMPDPIPALHSAAQSIIQIRSACTAHNLILPPLYIAETVLNVFGYDVNAELNAAMRRQRNALQGQIGAARTWLRIVPAAQLTYGLLKAAEGQGSVEHRAAAERTAASYGLVPALRSEFAELELAQLSQALQSWLEGRSNHASFMSTLAT